MFRMTSEDPSSVSRICADTFFWDRRRALGHGMFESFGATFFLLIAIEYYQADTLMQALVASGGFLGMILSPVLVFLVRQFRAPVSSACALLCLISSASLAIGVFLDSAICYTVTGITALIGGMGCIPMMTQIYQQNYPEDRRGNLFGSVNRIKVLVLAVFSALTGWALKIDMDWMVFYLLVVAGAFLFSAYCFRRIPSAPLEPEPGHFPYRSLRLLRQNRYFLWLIIMWMFMGFGNLMMMPLRIKVLVEPQFGYQYSPLMVAFLTSVIPPLTIFLFARLWGRLFDKMNFFLLRMVLNIFFIISIGSYFLLGNLVGLLFGAFMLGMAFAGGNVAWSLWVTKIAPAGEVADYMSVHTMMTGLRGLIAPLIAIPLVEVLPLYWVVAISIGLMLISVVMLIPELHSIQRRRKGYPVTGDVQE